MGIGPYAIDVIGSFVLSYVLMQECPESTDFQPGTNRLDFDHLPYWEIMTPVFPL